MRPLVHLCAILEFSSPNTCVRIHVVSLFVLTDAGTHSINHRLFLHPPFHFQYMRDFFYHVRAEAAFLEPTDTHLRKSIFSVINWMYRMSEYHTI